MNGEIRRKPNENSYFVDPNADLCTAMPKIYKVSEMYL